MTKIKAIIHHPKKITPVQCGETTVGFYSEDAYDEEVIIEIGEEVEE